MSHIEHRAYYDRLLTWAATTFEDNPDKCREFQSVLKERTALLVSNLEEDAVAPLLSVLSEIGLAAVLDAINNRREAGEGE